MNIFYLIEIEKEKTGCLPCYIELDHNRQTIFQVFKKTTDPYGNVSKKVLFSTPDIIAAKNFLRSCRLTEGILIS